MKTRQRYKHLLERPILRRCVVKPRGRRGSVPAEDRSPKLGVAHRLNCQEVLQAVQFLAPREKTRIIKARHRFGPGVFDSPESRLHALVDLRVRVVVETAKPTNLGRRLSLPALPLTHVDT